MLNLVWLIKQHGEFMKILLPIIATLTLFVSCSSNVETKSSALNLLVDDYDMKARELIKDNKNKVSSKILIKDAQDLIKKAGPILTAFTGKYPQCEVLLNSVVKSAPAMQNLTLDQIEKQYHEGSALPKADDICFEAKELIVHPATVVIISKQKKLVKTDRIQIHDEIAEVLGHLDLFKDSI